MSERVPFIEVAEILNLKIYELMNLAGCGEIFVESYSEVYRDWYQIWPQSFFDFLTHGQSPSFDFRLMEHGSSDPDSCVLVGRTKVRKLLVPIAEVERVKKDVPKNRVVGVDSGDVLWVSKDSTRAIFKERVYNLSHPQQLILGRFLENVKCGNPWLKNNDIMHGLDVPDGYENRVQKVFVNHADIFAADGLIQKDGTGRFRINGTNVQIKFLNE